MLILLGTETLKVGRHLTLNSLKQKFKDVFRLSCDFTLKKAQLNDASGKFLLTDILGVTVRDIKLECKRSKIYILPDEEVRLHIQWNKSFFFIPADVVSISDGLSPVTQSKINKPLIYI